MSYGGRAVADNRPDRSRGNGSQFPNEWHGWVDWSTHGNWDQHGGWGQRCSDDGTWQANRDRGRGTWKSGWRDWSGHGGTAPAAPATAAPDPAPAAPAPAPTPISGNQEADSAVAANSAVAATGIAEPSADVFDLTYFQQFRGFTRSPQQHNAALKWFRDSGEDAGLSRLTFNNIVFESVPQIVHPPGMDYHFDKSITHHWRWQEMIAQLRDEDMRDVVVGDSSDDANRSRGLIGCMIEKSGVYDHKRHFAARTRNEQLDEKKYIWNFVLERDDGSLVSLHPNFKGPKVECRLGGWCSDDGELPGSGKGGTSGKGTYRHFKLKYTDVTLRFDARKTGKGTPQSRSRPASSSTA